MSPYLPHCTRKLLTAALICCASPISAQTPAPPPVPPARSPWRWFAAPAAAALGFAVYYASLPGTDPAPKESAGPVTTDAWGLRFDRDDAAFAARANRSGKEKK